MINKTINALIYNDHRLQHYHKSLASNIKMWQTILNHFCTSILIKWYCSCYILHKSCTKPFCWINWIFPQFDVIHCCMNSIEYVDLPYIKCLISKINPWFMHFLVLDDNNEKKMLLNWNAVTCDNSAMGFMHINGWIFLCYASRHKFIYI